MATMPANYYSRYDESKEYDEHLFIAGRALQSAELNEIQKLSSSRLKSIADVLFKDGDIIRDAAVVVNSITGVTTCGSGAVYLRGAVRGVPSASLTVPIVGTYAIGIRIFDTVVTTLEDSGLRDPAIGLRNYQEPGASRLQAHTAWGWSGDGQSGDFYPVYTVSGGLLGAKEPPPNIDAIAQALARYDRDSAGGQYVVSGLKVQMLPDVGGVQYYSIAEGRARVFGYGVEYKTARRLSYAAAPDLKTITNEPFLSTNATTLRVNLSRTPAINISAVSITAEKTVTLTHNVATGGSDTLPDTSVLSIQSVVQGGTTYVATTSYLLTAGKVDWSPAGPEPAGGSTYQVTYRYITTATPSAVDDNGYTVAGAVVGTLVLTTYSQKLPRIDRLCLDADGTPVWLAGVAADYLPQLPTVPASLLPLASVYQTWTTTRKVVNDGVRVVPMPVLANIDNRLDLAMQLIAQQRLESNIHTRETGIKKGLFTDPFINDSQRDAGTVQTAAIVGGELLLPIAATISSVSADMTVPTTCTFSGVTALEQLLRTGSMKINPYMSFAPVPAVISLTPNVDRWTVVTTDWASASTGRFVVGSGDQSSSVSTTRTALLSTTTQNIETLRAIPVSFSVSGFGVGEIVTSLTFDGISVTMTPAAPVANASGIATGSFTIPSNVPAGDKLVAFVGGSGAKGNAVFSGHGTLIRQLMQQQTTVTETRWQSPPPPPPIIEGGGGGGAGVDPLAQTFTLLENRQITAVDLWFVVRSTTKTRVQIRQTELGFPNSTIVAEAVLEANSMNLGGVATRATFRAPVLLLGDVEYAIVVLSNDSTGEISVAELGKFDATAQQWITSQPYTVGVMLSSSNAVTWTPHQDRDMTFRLIAPSFTQTSRTVSLGQVAVTAATDLLLMAYAERPSSATDVQYTLTLPDLSSVIVSDGQPVQLPAAITGNVLVSALLKGTAGFSPVLHPGSQLVSGVLGTTGTYVSVAIPAGTSVKVKVIYEGIIPSGASVLVQYKGIDVGDVFATVPATTSSAANNGFTEFIHEITGVTETAVQVRLTLNGTAAARPRVRDLRVIVM